MAEDAVVLTQRMLRRLPPSLWVQDLGTTQAKIYAAIADELTRWRHEWEVVRQCTLLQEASGIDLDFLLQDFTLRRYNQRPDNIARQLARQILWTPKGTLYSMQEVGRLLTDAPQLVARSGRHQPHYWVALTQPIRFARTYWQLGDSLGHVWYLSLGENSCTVSASPPPGANTTPWPDNVPPPVPGGGPPAWAGGWEDVRTLMWLQIVDATQAPWYLLIEPGGSLQLQETAPSQGHGTTQPLQLLDGDGEAWGLQADATEVTITVVPLTTPLVTTTYWRIRDTAAVVWIVYVSEGSLAIRPTPAPLGWENAGPGAGTFDWVEITTTVTRWLALSPAGGFLLSTTQPAGSGSTAAMQLRESASGNIWQVSLDSAGTAFALQSIVPPIGLPGTPMVVLDPLSPAQYLKLRDQSAQDWYLSRTTGTFAAQATLPEDHVDATPAGGPFTWWRLEALDGTVKAVYVNPGDGVLIVSASAPTGLGTATPRALADASGVLWHYGITSGGALASSNTPPLDFGQAATCLLMSDPVTGRWCWRVDPDTGEALMSRVVEPNVIPWQPLGEIGWLRAPDTETGQSWYISASEHHAFVIAHAPPLGCPWGIEATDVTLIDITGQRWQFGVDVGGILRTIPIAAETIPHPTPMFFVRDAADALRHVQASGNLTTLWAL